jgi:hypothetical protein
VILLVENEIKHKTNDVSICENGVTNLIINTNGNFTEK